MDNYQIADYFSLLGKLAEIHGENAFKAKAYSSTAFMLEKLAQPITELPRNQWAGIRGIGASGAQKIAELVDTGKLSALEELLTQTPSGILDMLRIKGLGPKKITVIWKEMEIETLGELLYACRDNRLSRYKGFGEKTQQQIQAAIEFYQRNQGSLLWAQAETITPEIISFLQKILPNTRLSWAGEFLTQEPTLDVLSLVAVTTIDEAVNALQQVPEFTIREQEADSISWQAGSGIRFRLHACQENNFIRTIFVTSASSSFFATLDACVDWAEAKSVEDVFQLAGFHTVTPARWHDSQYLVKLDSLALPGPISAESIRGIIHSHSIWSDGSHSLAVMAEAAKTQGLEYLVISDHSQAAFYANGLTPERILAQQQEIQQLNTTLAPFRIYSSMECDILSDGQLDYDESVWQSLDLIIASVHSNLKMTEEKAMMRLLRAIEHPYTNILGHMTGRLLLSRPGYPIDHAKIIDACAANDVAIEINAHPSRLDLDWRWVNYALDKGVLLSINPDAHEVNGFKDVQYGIRIAQKTRLEPKQNLSSFSKADFESWIVEQHRKRSH